MNVRRARLLALCAVLCGAGSAATGAPDPPAPMLTTPEARDPLSYAQPTIARVTHVDLDLTVDFATRTVGGTAALTLIARPDARSIVLDDNGLVIARIADAAGHALQWRVGAGDRRKGAPLTIEIGRARRVVVTYRSRPDAGAFDWLPPSLTAGRRKPFLYSQGEAIENRSWIPTQDSPGIRQSWTASLRVPADLVAVMSGDRLTPGGEPAGPGWRRYRFRMDHDVPPYLIALAVGDIGFRTVGPRTGVYTEPVELTRDGREFADMGQMLDEAERLLGPYRWGRYDVLVLPPSFPYGGMENPTLTFATPTIVTGDRSNVDVIAHELAHSWAGNLVTNATWADSWLNEGFTVYLENRIDEALYGRERAAVLADLGWDRLERDLKRAKADETRLHGEPDGIYGELDYTKGSVFLRTIEYAVGRPAWDAYLRSYFDRHAFQPQTSAGFLADLRANLIRGDAALERRLQLDRWVYGTGLPDNAVHVRSAALTRIDTILTGIAAGASPGSIDAGGGSTQEWQHFLDRMPRPQSADRLADLDRRYRLSDTDNAAIRSAWLTLAFESDDRAVLPSAERFLPAIGRTSLVLPVYRALAAQQPWGRPAALRLFAMARANYHPVTRAAVARLLGVDAS